MASEERPCSPRLCANKCGFYGSDATGGMCSRCYRDTQKEEEMKRQDASVAPPPVAAAVAKSEESPSSPSLCAGGCGFFSNGATEGLCSRCYIDSLKVKETTDPDVAQSAITAAVAESVARTSLSDPTTPTADVANSMICSSSSDPSLSTTADSVVTSAASAKLALSRPGGDLSVKGRCASCNKKLGVLKGFQCKCGNSYCASHRYAEQHDCAYDYKAEGRAFLEKKNPVIKSEKLEKF